jgi:quercetin dioxygenase-like cupin family protein
MPILIPTPTRIEAAGNKPKLIDEYVGRVNSQSENVSIARMRSPAGWVEPGQRPAFDEYTLVLKGMLRVEHEQGSIDVREGQAIHTKAGEWIRYSTPEEPGAEYVAVCLPAFSPDTVHRDGLTEKSLLLYEKQGLFFFLIVLMEGVEPPSLKGAQV